MSKDRVRWVEIRVPIVGFRSFTQPTKKLSIAVNSIAGSKPNARILTDPHWIITIQDIRFSGSGFKSSRLRNPFRRP